MTEIRKQRIAQCLISTALLLAGSMAGAVDGVIEINQAAAEAGGITLGDAPGLPVQIFSPGSYRLTGNLSDKSGASSSMISITASGVTLDLGGFEVAGDSLTGVGILADTIDVTVRNGRVRDLSGLGIDLGSRGRVEGVTVRNALGGGIECGADCKLRDVVLSGNSGTSLECAVRCEVLDSTVVNSNIGAITAGSGSRIHGNQVANGGTLITVDTDSIVAHNTISDGNAGIVATGPVSIERNVVTGSNSTAIFVTGMGKVEGNVVVGSTGGSGIHVGAGSLVRANTVRDAWSVGLSTGASTIGYEGNVFSNNNGGDANAQVSGAGLDLGGNLCGDPPACP